MVEYNNSYAGQGYAVQPGSVPPVDPITPGVPPVDPQKAKDISYTRFYSYGFGYYQYPDAFPSACKCIGVSRCQHSEFNKDC